MPSAVPRGRIRWWRSNPGTGDTTGDRGYRGGWEQKEHLGGEEAHAALHQLSGPGTRFSDLCRNPPSKAIFSKRQQPPGTDSPPGAACPRCPLGGARHNALIRLMS